MLPRPGSHRPFTHSQTYGTSGICPLLKPMSREPQRGDADCRSKRLRRVHRPNGEKAKVPRPGCDKLWRPGGAKGTGSGKAHCSNGGGGTEKSRAGRRASSAAVVRSRGVCRRAQGCACAGPAIAVGRPDSPRHHPNVVCQFKTRVLIAWQRSPCLVGTPAPAVALMFDLAVYSGSGAWAAIAAISTPCQGSWLLLDN